MLLSVFFLFTVPEDSSAGPQRTPYSGEVNLAAPDQITLKGNIRREEISTPLGTVDLRWPRTAEVYFGRTPVKAMADAARTVSQAIRTSAFPSEIQRLNTNWNVVFMDEKLPQTQIPAHLINNCHPGWMTPPANIYIVAQRVAGGCGQQPRNKSSVADSDLASVLVHEMGHAVEFHLLQGMFAQDRMRAEGFASWFQVYAANYSSVIDRGAQRRDMFSRAKYSIRQNPSGFSSGASLFAGDSLDYARASMYFFAVVDRRGLGGLMEVYQAIAKDKLTFFAAVQKEIGWNSEQLEKEVQRIAQKY